MLTRNKLFAIWLLGAISGFTLMIGGNTLNYWLATEHIDIRTIGIFAFTSLPYAVNFLWAPIFDIKKLGYLTKIFGQRLSWLLLIQIALAINVFILGSLNPTNHIFIFAIFALIISFLSSAQDAILGALRTEIISSQSQGVASGIYIFGYRIGMLISSSGAIYFSDYLGLNKIYQLFSLVILICPILLIFNIRNISASTTTSEQIGQLVIIAINPGKKGIMAKIVNLMVELLKPVGSPSFLILALLFLILYRLPDNLITIMLNPFLIHLEFGGREVASIGKFFGLITAIIGGFIAAWVMRKKTIVESLLIFGIIHALAHSLFIIQEIYGKSWPLLFLVIGFESITGGMTMAAYIAFIGSLCQGKFRATQYSFFSAMMGLSRSIFPAISGQIVIKFGWQKFFIFTSLAAIPSLILLYLLMTRYKAK